MCEMLAFTCSSPVPMEDILRWSMLLDEYGVAGYSWGMTWSWMGQLHRYRAVDGIRRDSAGAKALKNVMAQRGFVHLRRPSLMSTIAHVNAQPYLSSDHVWSFAHNGFLVQHNEFRDAYRTEILGSSDSEVGFCYWLSQVRLGAPLAESLVHTHETLTGKANFMAMSHQGELGVYAGNEENPVYRFRIGPVQLASTALHSLDTFLFDAIFPEATDIERIPFGQAILMP